MKHASPYSIFFIAVEGCKHALEILAIVVLVLASYVGWDNVMQPSLIVASILITLLCSTMVYLNFTYEIKDDCITVSKGVFFKKHIRLPFADIENEVVSQPFYFEKLKLANLALDSAGSSGQEIVIPALTLVRAEEIVKKIGTRKHTHKPTETDAKQPSKNEIVVTKIMSEIMINAICHSKAWMFGLFLVAWIDDIKEKLGSIAIEYDLVTLGGALLSELSIYETLALGLAMVVLLVCLALLYSIAQLLPYNLTFSNGNWVLRSGSLTKRQIKVGRSKIHSILIQQNGLDKLFDRSNIVLEPVRNIDQEGVAGNIQTIMVPNTSKDERDRIISRTFPELPHDKVPIRNISIKYIKNRLMVVGMPIILVTALCLEYAQWPSLLVSVWLIALPVYFYTKYRRFGIGANKEALVFRFGLMGKNYRIAPIDNVKSISFQQSKTHKRKGVATLRIDLASGRYKIPFMDESEAKNLMNYILAARAGDQFDRSAWSGCIL